MTTCLLVIDAQASFTQRPYYHPEPVAAYLRQQNALIAGCLARGIPVLRVYHLSPDGDVADPFSPASGWVRPLDGLQEFDAAHTLLKTRHSALVGTDLQDWLQRHGIRQVLVSGVRTEQCCETTARHLSDLGWSVLFVLDATLTWDMRTLDGQPLPAAAIRERTAAVLQGRFARVLGVADALALSDSGPSLARAA